MKRSELPGLLKNAFLVVTLFNRQLVWCEKNVFSIKLTFTETLLLIYRRNLLNILLFMAKITPYFTLRILCWLSSRHSSNKLVPRVPLPSARPAGGRELPGEKTGGDTQRNPPRRLRIPVPNHYWYLIWRWCFGYPLVKVSIRAIPRSLVIWVSPVTLQNSCKIVSLFACFFRSVCWKAFPFRTGKPKISNLSKTISSQEVVRERDNGRARGRHARG